ncbi:MAG: hypothetical protein M1434_10340 [Chloroflexi bacterium]|nr:hypothetical protein [Chloroflexota bacterium]MCL5275125.1 hypothetical protein [Chloroflexota bacterium]
MKQVPAIIAALIITGMVGLGVFAIGANAFLNTDTVAIQNSPADASIANVSANGSASDAAAQAQIKQLQDAITQYQAREKQYQDREKQYQTELKDAAQKVSDANSLAQQYQDQVQQYQNIFVQLQQMGVIRVGSDGRISVPRGRESDEP